MSSSSSSSSAPTYTVGGKLSGLSSGAGISVSLVNGGDTLTLTQDGSFSFATAQPSGSAYDVTVSTQPPFPQRCSVTSGNGAVGGAAVTDVSVTCSAAIVERSLHSFVAGINDGDQPYAGLVMDGRGNLYGTTRAGGAADDGIVFELEPDGKGGYTEKVLYSFGGADGINPSTLLLDNQGNLYGTTYSGGAANSGTVFELKPDGSGGYTETVLHSFSGGSPDGANPNAGVIMDGQGNLFGTTRGDYAGTVFELKPNGSGGYTESSIYTFPNSGCCDGIAPNGALVLDSHGNLYGTTESGGLGGGGTVFVLKPDDSGGYTESVVYRFLGGSDGYAPEAALIIDAQGNLYGTTEGGGGSGNGTVFVLKPDGSGGYTESVLYRFAGSFSGVIDAGSPTCTLVMDSQGNLFGTTAYGGSSDGGTVFELQPDGSGGYTESVLYSFPGVGPGPNAGLTLDSQGNLYGTTVNGYGAVFEIL